MSMINNANYCFSVVPVGTHNRLVVGSNPTGATKQNKELDEKSSDSFFFGCDLGQVMGQVRNCYPALFISLPASPDSDESQ